MEVDIVKSINSIFQNERHGSCPQTKQRRQQLAKIFHSQSGVSGVTFLNL